MNSNSDINGSLSALRKVSISQQKDQNSNLVSKIHPQLYQMNFKQEIVRKKRENVIKMLEDKFPKEFALIYCGLMFFLGVFLIILQSFNRVNDNRSAIVFGIFGGVSSSLIGVLTLFLITFKNYYLISLAYGAHIICIIFIILTFITNLLYTIMNSITIVMIVLCLILIILILYFIIMIFKIL